MIEGLKDREEMIERLKHTGETIEGLKDRSEMIGRLKDMGELKDKGDLFSWRLKGNEHSYFEKHL